MMNDDTLLYEISLGNETAFSRFFNLHRDKVYGYLLSFVKLHEIAEELTLDVFFKIWQKKETLQVVHEPQAYLFTISKNKALDFLKTASRHAQVQQWIAEQIRTVQQGIATANAAQQLEHKELLTLVLNELSPQRRVILTLSRVEGLTHDEIARRLNISRSTVKNTISHTLKTLEQLRRTLGVETCWLLFLAERFWQR
ncbi:sigma-70 family RNA polymerase sigma factor [Niabella sp.]|uniref:RNA polymerase sigma factor n=1 Tax=Niabella sp. TaxID=1962976 RepID=UPI002629374E|nr:sigma-70 family RNA polymerase sigma factor [Niabella sp.]